MALGNALILEIHVLWVHKKQRQLVADFLGFHMFSGLSSRFCTMYRDQFLVLRDIAWAFLVAKGAFPGPQSWADPNSISALGLQHQRGILVLARGSKYPTFKDSGPKYD